MDLVRASSSLIEFIKDYTNLFDAEEVAELDGNERCGGVTEVTAAIGKPTRSSTGLFDMFITDST